MSGHPTPRDGARDHAAEYAPQTICRGVNETEPAATTTTASSGPSGPAVPDWLTGVRVLAGPAQQAMPALHSQYQADVAAFDDAGLPHAEAVTRWIQRATDYEAIADTVAEAADTGRGLHAHADLARQLAATAMAHARQHADADLSDEPSPEQLTAQQAPQETSAATWTVCGPPLDQDAGRTDRRRRAAQAHYDASQTKASAVAETGEALEAIADAEDLAHAFVDEDEDGNP